MPMSKAKEQNNKRPDSDGFGATKAFDGSVIGPGGQKDLHQGIQYIADLVIEIKETIYPPHIAAPVTSPTAAISTPASRRRLITESTCLILAIIVTIFSADPCLAVPSKYTIIDLGTLGGRYSIAHAINNAGQIVGESDRCAFLWDNKNGMTDLGTLSDGNYMQAWGINDSAEVVGYSNGQMGWRSFRWQKGKMTDLGTLGGHTKAYDINSAGVVVGRSEITGGRYHAFLWQHSTPISDLGVIGNGKGSRAYGINDTGQVVGASLSANGQQHAFLWGSTKGMLDLGTLPGNEKSLAYAINNSGEVVGASYNADGICRAFLWDSENGMIDLGNLGDGKDERSWSTGNAWEVADNPRTALNSFGGRHSGAKGINNAGEVVGYLYLPDGNWHAFLWSRSEGMVDLNNLLPADHSWKCIKEAFDINNQGQIVGYGITKNDRVHAFLMRPMPAGH
jgi:probable HAF family extracellular repeat protein